MDGDQRSTRYQPMNTHRKDLQSFRVFHHLGQDARVGNEEYLKIQVYIITGASNNIKVREYENEITAVPGFFYYLLSNIFHITSCRVPPTFKVTRLFNCLDFSIMKGSGA